MGVFPTPHQVVHSPQAVTGVDEHGQYIVGDPVDTVRDVYGWFPAANGGTNSNPFMNSGIGMPATMSNRLITGLCMLTPDGDWTEGDIVTVPADGGNLYQVNGEPEDYSAGPFGFAPGYVVRLTRVSDA